jgi:hypothetical protein
MGVPVVENTAEAAESRSVWRFVVIREFVQESLNLLWSFQSPNKLQFL